MGVHSPEEREYQRASRSWCSGMSQAPWPEPCIGFSNRSMMMMATPNWSNLRASTKCLFDGAESNRRRRDVVVCLSGNQLTVGFPQRAAENFPMMSTSSLLRSLDHAAASHAAMCLVVHSPHHVIRWKTQFLSGLRSHLPTLSEDDDAALWWVVWFYHMFREIPKSWSHQFRKNVVHGHSAAARVAAAVLAHHTGVTHATSCFHVYVKTAALRGCHKLGKRAHAHGGTRTSCCRFDHTANSCLQPGPWPLAWVLAAVPTLWFPICRKHVTTSGHGPQVFCALSIDPTGVVRMTPDGPVLVETVDCCNESCQAAHQWAHAHARHRWPLLVANVRHMLHGNPWAVDGALLPSHDECHQLLLNRNWIGHAKFPIPIIIATVCRFFRTVECPEPPMKCEMECESC